MSLKEDLQDWTDIDWASYRLACHLGFMKDGDFQVKVKHVFCTENKLSVFLSDILESFCNMGILEEHPEELQYRWNQKFQGSWENKEN